MKGQIMKNDIDRYIDKFIEDAKEETEELLKRIDDLFEKLTKDEEKK